MINLNLGKKVGFAALLAFSATSVNAVVLDTFDYGNDNFVNVMTDDTDPNFIKTITFANDLGAADVHFSQGLDDDANTYFSSVLATNGNLTFSNASGVDAKLELVYDGPGPNVTPLSFASVGSAFYYDTVFSDTGFDITFTVTDTTGNSDSLVYVSSAYDSSDFGGDLLRSYIGFDQFTGVDFMNIASTSILFDTTSAADFTLAEVGLIPEPTTVAIFGLGLIGFAASRKRKA